MAVCAGFSSVVVSALYDDNLKALQLYKHAHFLWGVCLVLIYGYGRLCLKMHRGETGDDPVAFAVKDKVSHVCFLFVCVLIFLAA